MPEMAEWTEGAIEEVKQRSAAEPGLRMVNTFLTPVPHHYSSPTHKDF